MNTHDLGSWIRHETSGDTVLVDPSTDEPLAGQAPHFITAERGHDLARMREIPLAIDLALGGHTEVTDLDADGDPMWFERSLANKALRGYFYEGIYGRPWSAAAIKLDGYILRTLFMPRRSFETRRNYAIATSKAHCAPYDISRRDTVATELDRQAMAIIRHPQAPARLALEAMVISQCVREWTIAANVGRLAAALARRRTQGDTYPVVMTAGAGHYDLGRKLESMGATTTVVHMQREKYQHSWPVKFLPPALRDGRITAAEFARFEEHIRSGQA